MQIAERVYSLAQGQDDPILKIWAYKVLACTLYFLGDFETSGQNAVHGVRIWRSGNVQALPEDVDTPIVSCLKQVALSEWHLGEIASSQLTIAEAISLAKELNDTNALALALNHAAELAMYERNLAEVDRLTSDLIELSTRQNFAHWVHQANIYRGWVRSVCGDTAKGIPWIEQGIRDYRANGTILVVPFLLGLKAEALHLADRTSEALGATNEAQVLAERFEERWRLRFAKPSALHGSRSRFR